MTTPCAAGLRSGAAPLRRSGLARDVLSVRLRAPRTPHADNAWARSPWETVQRAGLDALLKRDAADATPRDWTSMASRRVNANREGAPVRVAEDRSQRSRRVTILALSPGDTSAAQTRYSAGPGALRRVAMIRHRSIGSKGFVTQMSKPKAMILC